VQDQGGKLRVRGRDHYIVPDLTGTAEADFHSTVCSKKRPKKN